MDTPRRMPLQDLPLEQFLTHGTITASKTPRKHKRPLSPSCTPLNPAKRRVLDAEGVPPSTNVAIPSRIHSVPYMLSMHSVTPTRPSRLGNAYPQNYGHSPGTRSPLASQRSSPSRELYSKPTTESSTIPQSRHYPGFDIYQDTEHRRASPGPRVTPPSGGDALVDKSEEDKENVPLRRKAKKSSSKKRGLRGPDSSNPSSPAATTQTSRVDGQLERTPFSSRQTLR